MTAKEHPAQSPVIIKKYANRRLYNTATSSYVTLENLSIMVREGQEFVVYDAKTSEDITRAVLTQIIVEEEQKGGQNLLPIGFLRQLIGFYGGNMQWMVPRYLEYAMKTFTVNQEKLRQNMPAGLGQFFSLTPLEEMSKQNIALFERAIRMFTPFNEEGSAEAAAPPATITPAPQGPTDKAAFKALTERLDALQEQLDSLRSSGGK
jgi:polyhydroxyalkanoate synthesis repressor PhaR